LIFLYFLKAPNSVEKIFHHAKEIFGNFLTSFSGRIMLQF
jgi:hypothetical protein